MARNSNANGATPVVLVGGGRLLVVGRSVDERLIAIAEAQHAHASRAQLLAIGFTAAAIRTRLHRGTLHQRHRSVYRVGPSLEVELGDETAALLAIRHGVLSHRSAASALGLVPAPPADVHVTTRRSARTLNRPGIRAHRTLSLTAKDLSRHRGLPITTAARTLVDLADDVSTRELERALDEALHRRLVTPAAVQAAIARAPGRRGAPTLGALLDPDRALGITRSQAEERMLGLIRSAGLPDPERNVTVGPYEVDFLWREQRLVVEVDSYAWHSGPRAFKRDRRKDLYLAGRGLQILRVTWEMMDEPLPLIARLAREL